MSGDWEEVSGQLAEFPGAIVSDGLILTSGLVDPGVLRGQVRDGGDQVAGALRELSNVLEAAGSHLDHVMQVTAYLADRSLLAVWGSAFAATWPRRRPARTTLVSGLVMPGLLFEVQAIGRRVTRDEGTYGHTASVFGHPS